MIDSTLQKVQGKGDFLGNCQARAPGHQVGVSTFSCSTGQLLYRLNGSLSRRHRDGISAKQTYANRHVMLPCRFRRCTQNPNQGVSYTIELCIQILDALGYIHLYVVIYTNVYLVWHTLLEDLGTPPTWKSSSYPSVSSIWIHLYPTVSSVL